MRCSLLSCLALSRRELVWLSLAPLLVPIATQTGAFPSGIGSKPSRGTRPAPYRAGRVPRQATLAPKHIRELPWHLKRCPIMSLSLLETLLKLRGTRPARNCAGHVPRAARDVPRPGCHSSHRNPCIFALVGVDSSFGPSQVVVSIASRSQSQKDINDNSNNWQ